MQPYTSKEPDIILVDDHLIFRHGIKSIINFENIGNVIGEASNGKEFMDLISTCKPDLVLMDIDMPGMNGFEATKKALEINPRMKIIAFSAFADEEYLDKMIEYGAMGFILKTSGLSDLEMAIRKVMQGERYYSSELTELYADNSHDQTLTKHFENKTETSADNRKMRFFPWSINARKCF